MNMIDIIWIAITTLCLSQQISQCHTYSNVPATTPAHTSVHQIPFNKIGPSIQRPSIHKAPLNHGGAPTQQVNILTTSVPTMKGPTGSSAGTAVVFSFIKFYKSNTSNKKVPSNTEFKDNRFKGNVSNTETISTMQAALLTRITPNSTSAVMAYTKDNRELPVIEATTGTTPLYTMIDGTRYQKTQWTPIMDATTGRTPATAKDGTRDNETSQMIGSATENETSAVIVDTISKTPVSSIDGTTGNMTASVMGNRTPPMIDGTMNNRTPSMIDDNMKNRTPAVIDDTMNNRTPPMIDDTMNNRTPLVIDDTMNNRTPLVIDGTMINRTPPMIDDTVNNRTPLVIDGTMNNRTPPMIDGTMNNRTPPMIDDTMTYRTPPMTDDTMNNRTPPMIDGTMDNRTPPMIDATMNNRTPPKIDGTMNNRTPPMMDGTTNGVSNNKSSPQINGTATNRKTPMTDRKTDQTKSKINGIKDKNLSSGRATQVLSVDHEVRSPTTPPSPVGLIAESSMKYIIPTVGVALTVSALVAILFVYIRRRNHVRKSLPNDAVMYGALLVHVISFPGKYETVHYDTSSG
ncbi:cell wall protein DAN4 [Lingula anatina]|uniref:Cell wall protein DAN4 n=1 Tax=Lingula anatina TaxID=7574 RepID=A0A1S3K1L0_LINAN|nr:cell wall protein DAN4 [Lingula anatina]|eukprot:XP_013416156.1 cell wall protein DAN4 [Lingula anatina]